MPAPHEHKVSVRYGETDQMGVVHHANYLVYMEEGRIGLMRRLGFPYEGVEERGYAMAVRQADVRYRSAARFGDELLVRTWIERVRAASILYVYEIRREQGTELIATGSVETACLDLGTLRPMPLPTDILRAVETYLSGEPTPG